MQERLMLPLREAEDVRAAGAKAQNLARLHRLGVPVPDGLVLTDAALRRFLDATELHVPIGALTGRLETKSPTAIRCAAETIAALVREESLPDDLSERLRDLLQPLSGTRLIVRSSAIGEDSAAASFAGQLDSIPDVQPAGVDRAVIAVWASRWSERTLAYELARGVRLAGMGVIVQRQIDARVSGVLFTRAPGNPGAMLVEYCGGAGESLVSGRENPGRLAIARRGLAWTRQAEPERPAAHADLLLNDETLGRLARTALEIEQAFGCPQDIEWTIDGAGALWIVQARPITAGASRPPAILWSNANVNENFPLPISPLLYSVARAGYYHYFRNLGRAFGISRRRLAAMDPPLRHIIGVHGARMYYNLTNVHAVLGAAPFGDSLTRFFNRFVGADTMASPVLGPAEAGNGFAQMRPAAPAFRHERHETTKHTKKTIFGFVSFVASCVSCRRTRSCPSTWRSRARQAAEVAAIAVKTTWQYAWLTRRVERFERTADAFAARTHPSALAVRPARALLADLHAFLDIRCHRWNDAALADAAAMVCYGLLEKLLSRALPSADQHALHNTLLKALPGLVSSRPAIELWKLSRAVRADADLLRLLSAEPPAVVVAEVRRNPELAAFRAALETFLEDWGFRCSAELMLTVPSFQENPEPVIDLLRAYAAMDGDSPLEILDRQCAERLTETSRVRDALRRRRLFHRIPLVHQWAVVSVVLGWTQKSIQLRERARLKQALLYSRLRRIAMALGDRLAGEDRLAEPDDIFMLTTGEIDALVEGAEMFPHHVLELIRLRRRAHAELSATTPPDSMSLEHGEYLPVRGPEVRDSDRDCGDSRRLQGISACGGRTTARATILADVSESHLLARGDVLVTRQTDPGWGPVFPLISGLVMERGGMLSHGAIIAREFGIPSVVGVKDATRRISPGGIVRIDGDRGVVHLVEGAA